MDFHKNTRIITKARLISANTKARQAGANSIDPDFLQTIPSEFRYPVTRALPFPERHGFVRCWVGIGFSLQPDPATFDSHLMDLPNSVFEKLPICPA